MTCRFGFLPRNRIAAWKGRNWISFPHDEGYGIYITIHKKFKSKVNDVCALLISFANKFNEKHEAKASSLLESHARQIHWWWWRARIRRQPEWTGGVNWPDKSLSIKENIKMKELKVKERMSTDNVFPGKNSSLSITFDINNCIKTSISPLIFTKTKPRKQTLYLLLLVRTLTTSNICQSVLNKKSCPFLIHQLDYFVSTFYLPNVPLSFNAHLRDKSKSSAYLD